MVSSDIHADRPTRSAGTLSMQPIHGGRLNEAVKRWKIPHAQWLDLSTGINPNGWPVPPIPAHIWQRLPEADDGLKAVIREAAKPLLWFCHVCVRSVA